MPSTSSVVAGSIQTLAAGFTAAYGPVFSTGPGAAGVRVGLLPGFMLFAALLTRRFHRLTKAGAPA